MRNELQVCRRHPIEALRIIVGRILRTDVIVNSDGIRLVIGTHTGEGAWSALEGRNYEDMRRLMAIANSLGSDNLFVDVGANVGTYAVRVASEFPHLRVVAVEALPRNRERIRRSARLNRCNVEIIESAISDVEGETTIPLESAGRASVRVRSSARSITVTTSTIDALVARHAPRKLGLLKVDVDGMCLQALQGGNKTLSRCETIIYFENDPGTPEYLRELGYSVGCFDETCLRETDRGYALWAVPRRMIPRFADCLDAQSA